MKLWRDNLWEYKDGQDDRAFLKLEKDICKEKFAHITKILEAEEEEEESE